MDQEYPIKRNTFVLIAAVLFNLIWIALLFWSCQTDQEPNPTPTPEARILDLAYRDSAVKFGRTAAPNREDQIFFTVDPAFRQNSRSNCLIINPANYNVPEYSPPSTCNITPVI